MCCAADVLEGRAAVQVAITVCELMRFHNSSLKSPTRILSPHSTPSKTIATSPIKQTSPTVI